MQQIFYTHFFFFFGKFYWWLFTDKQLNSDTIIRLAYLHYVSAFYLVYISYIHTLDMHYDWKNEVSLDGIQTQLAWWDETLVNELSLTKDLLVFTACVVTLTYTDPEALSYEIFTWGDIGIMTDVRFYGVAPHWYFRPFMSWLISCPHHKTGIFGLILFFFLLFYQPTLHGASDLNEYSKRSLTITSFKFNKSNVSVNQYYNVENNLYTQQTFALFVLCCLYTTSFLPYGRFYNRLKGNFGSLLSFMYVFSYLTFPILRKPYTLESAKLFYFIKINYLMNVSRNFSK